jgi:hypothetical protein
MFVHTYTYKKRDCNHAVPLIEALVLPFVTNSNTVAHAICICITLIAHAKIHTIGILVSQCFVTVNLPDSNEPKHSAFKTLFFNISAQRFAPLPGFSSWLGRYFCYVQKMHILNSRCKITKNSAFLQIYLPQISPL